jgi:hypothetical protein
VTSAARWAVAIFAHDARPPTVPHFPASPGGPGPGPSPATGSGRYSSSILLECTPTEEPAWAQQGWCPRDSGRAGRWLAHNSVVLCACLPCAPRARLQLHLFHLLARASSLPGDSRVPAAAYSELFLGTSWSHPSPPAGAESESGVDAGAVFHWGAMYSPNHPALSKRRFGRKLDGRRSRADDESKLCPLLGRAFMPSICVVPV